MFGIRFLEPDPVLGPHERYGEIELGDRSERFQTCIGDWQEEDYVRMWPVGVERALSGQPGALINSHAGWHPCIFLSWWPLYRQGDVVLMHQHVLPVRQIETWRSARIEGRCLLLPGVVREQR